MRDGETGLHFRAGDAVDLVEKVRRLSVNPDIRLRMGMAARAEFEARYTAEANYHSLMNVYRDVTRHSSGQTHVRTDL